VTTTTRPANGKADATSIFMIDSLRSPANVALLEPGAHPPTFRPETRQSPVDRRPTIAGPSGHRGLPRVLSP
jgi:hypothetical protein